MSRRVNSCERARIERAELSYWRTSIGEEVDFVVEAGRVASCYRSK
jgi:predicted AAA+ superfamily ATPase